MNDVIIAYTFSRSMRYTPIKSLLTSENGEGSNGRDNDTYTFKDFTIYGKSELPKTCHITGLDRSIEIRVDY